MSIEYFDSEDELNEEFEEICDVNEEHLWLKEQVEDAEYQVELANGELEAAKEDLRFAMEELERFEEENRDKIIRHG